MHLALILGLLLSMLRLTDCFQFQQLQIQPDSTTIGVSTTYTFTFNRFQTNDIFGTAWDTTTVPRDSTIRIVFPTQYTSAVIAAATCDNLQILHSTSLLSISPTNYTCGVVSRTLTITGAITADLFIYSVTLTLGGVVNPTPASDTGNFQGFVGVDEAAASSNSFVRLSAATFESCSVTFDASNVNRSSTMVVTLDPRNSLDSSSQIQITVPQRWSLDIAQALLPLTSTMSCNNYSTFVSVSPTCTASTSVNFIIFVNNFLSAQTTSSFSFGVRSMMSPPTTNTPDIISITSYRSGFMVDRCTTVYVTGLTANSFNTLTLISNQTMIVNRNVVLRFQMNLTDNSNQEDNVQIEFPSEIAPTFVTISGTGVYFTPAGTLNIGIFTTNHSSALRSYLRNSLFVLNFTRVKLPPSTKTSNPIIVRVIKGAASTGYVKMIGSVTLTANPSTLTGSVLATVSTVGKVTSYTFTITIGDGLLSSGMIRINFPSTITPTLSTNCATLSGPNSTNLRTLPTCAYTSVTNSILLSTLNLTSSAIGAQTFTATLLNIRNAPSVSPSGSFQVTTFYNSDGDGMVSQGNIAGITATLDVINPASVSVVPSSYVVAATVVNYTVTFTSGNAIGQGGYIELFIPNGVTLNTAGIGSYCRLSINGGSFFSTTCTGATATGGYLVTFNNVASSAAIPAASIIAMRIESLFTNPGSTAIVSSFGIKTYHSDLFGIEELSTGIMVQMTTPAPMTSITVTRNSNLNSDPAVSYTFRLRQVPALPAAYNLLITFPSALALTNSITCSSLASASLNCNRSSNTVTVSMNSAVVSGAEFGVIINNVKNPASFAPITGAFTFATRSTDNLRYAQDSQVSNLANTLPSTFATSSAQFSNLIYNEATSMQLTLTPSSIAPSTILVTLPGSFSVPVSLSCTSSPCTPVSTNGIELTGITSSAQVVFTVTGMLAPLTLTTLYVSVASFDSGRYKIDENLQLVQWQAGCTLPCRTCLVGNSSACTSCYSNIAISSFFYLYEATNLCYQSCPPNTFLNTTTTKCMICNSICQECLGTATNCTSCYNSTLPLLFIANSTGTCRSQCPTYFYPDTTLTPPTCVPCLSPCLDCSAQFTCLSCVSGIGRYLFGTECRTSCPVGTTIANPTTDRCDNCSSECGTCQGTITNCSSCSISSALYLGQCVSICPLPLVKRNGQCLNCSSDCLTCSISFDNCTSCNTSATLKYLYGNVCLPGCPELFYQDLTNGLCRLCSTLNIGCDNCTSTSTCGTCNWAQGFVFLTNQCFSTVPIGYYNNTGYALPCSVADDCATCANQANNCTSCISLNLQGNRCVPVCSAGSVGVNKICQPCTNNCRTCFNLQSNCTSCVNLFFLSNFQCETTCPNYTYANQSNNECTACEQPCESCTSRTQCSTCLPGFFLNGTECLVSCPYGYLGINRICQRCTPQCDNCSLSLTRCLTCLPGFYFVSATFECRSTCPTGLYPNDALGSCTGCTSTCNTCQMRADNCTSCTGTLNLHLNRCIGTCPDGFYALNNNCNPCNTNCSTCSSSSVCLTCQFGLFMYQGNCISTCPSTHPVTLTGTCSACSDTSCLVCDALDQCTTCNFPSLLIQGDCVPSCPTDYVSNGTHCNYSPPPVTPNNTNTANNTNTTANEQLSQTLSSSNIFPVPFTIAAAFVGVACIMSRFQHSYTFVSGSLYALWSLLEVGALAVLVYLYWTRNTAKIGFSMDYLQSLVVGAAILLMYLLNLLALIAQNCYLRGDAAFKKWLQKQSANSCFYALASMLGLFVNHKFKNILFCKLFGFDIFKGKLDSVGKFRIFNIFSFLSFVPSAAIIFGTSYMIYEYHSITQELMAYIDVLVMTVACMVLAILNSRKDDDFFEEKDDDGVILNKRVADSDYIMQEAIAPLMAEFGEQRGNMRQHKHNETQRKLQLSIETISDASAEPNPSYSYKQVKYMQNISIQAAPILEDYSKINFYNDEQLSEMSMFHKHDRSVDMTRNQFQYADMSIQNDMNIFDNREASVQHEIDARDISLQNVQPQEECGMQVSRHEEHLGMQAVAQNGDASVQYSAKPVFEDLDQDFDDSHQASIDQTNNRTQEVSAYQVPAVRPAALKPQLQLDVDQRLRRKQQQLQQQQLMRRQLEKQQTIQRFHAQMQAQQLPREQKLELLNERNLQQDRVNNFYNNDNSRADNSSLLDSNANMLVHFRNNQSKIMNEPASREQSRPVNPHEDSAITEKQFIQMLSNREEEPPHNNQHNLEPSMSFNMTKDLEDAGLGRRDNRVIYEEADRSMGDEEDGEIHDGEPIQPHQPYILQNQSNEEIPSGFEKSRSTNIKSTARDGRRPPLPSRTFSKNLFDDSSNMENSVPQNEYEEINYNPIKPIVRHPPSALNRPMPPPSNQAIRNSQSFENKRKNLASAQLLHKIQFDDHEEPEQDGDVREIRQNPLPLPKIERLKSQESNYSDGSSNIYRMSSRKVLLEDRKLQFDEAEKIKTEQDDDFSKNMQLPRVAAKQKRPANSKSQQKLPTQSYEKPVHRQLLGRERFVDRTEKYLEKELRKAENTKKKIEQMEVMLERPGINKQRGYLKETHSSLDKKHKAQFQRIYLNNPFEKKP